MGAKFKIGDKVLYLLDERRWVYEVKGVYLGAYPGHPTEYWILQVEGPGRRGEGRTEEKNLIPVEPVKGWDLEKI